MFLLDEQEQKNAPESFELKKAGGKKFGDYGFRVQVSPLDGLRSLCRCLSGKRKGIDNGTG